MYCLVFSRFLTLFPGVVWRNLVASCILYPLHQREKRSPSASIMNLRAKYHPGGPLKLLHPLTLTDSLTHARTHARKASLRVRVQKEDREQYIHTVHTSMHTYIHTYMTKFYHGCSSPLQPPPPPPSLHTNPIDVRRGADNRNGLFIKCV